MNSGSITDQPGAAESLTVVLCSTHRLARGLRMAQARRQTELGHTQWRPLAALILAQWLDGVLEEALLNGQLAAESVSGMLSPLQERILWQRAIRSALSGAAAAALFDQQGLAAAAMEANHLLLAWEMPLGSDDGERTEETRQFLRWREAFRKSCAQSGCLEPARHFDWQIEQLARGAGCLPTQLYIAGFDRISPQEQRLFDVLAIRGTGVERWQTGLGQPASAVQAAYDDAEAECRAAATWAKAQLAASPQARIAIVAPELALLRSRLASLLDEVLQPETLHPARAQAPRCYDFSLGAPLAAQPLVATALALLRLTTQRQRLSQQDVGCLLGDVYWSAGISEADARALLEAQMRRRLGASLHLNEVLRLAREVQGNTLEQLIAHLQALANAGWSGKQKPAAWAAAFGELLAAAGWPGERSLSSHEFQARQTWQKTLAELAGLNDLLGSIAATEALGHLARLCQERIFQPEAEADSPLQVMGMLEAASAPLDAVWIMGMNDQLWPPPVRPNPLLPAEAQRRAGLPNSCSRVQGEFAAAVHRRLMHSAPQVVFSWARKDGERELRPSPLLAGIAAWADAVPPAATLTERLALVGDMQRLDDHLAPPVTEGEQVKGGYMLLRAQAICPAWAYYCYRLGARALEEPVEGLDDMERGNLLHAALQCFWSGRDAAYLQGLDRAALEHAVAAAVEDGVRHFSQALDKPLPARFLALEKQRLQLLVTAWLDFERGRTPFTVEECERQARLDIEGITVELKLDRVDALEDGRLAVIDYKTGATVSHKSWADGRISEPQLPIYAALALSGENVAAVCFAKVRLDEQKFVGISRDPDILPGVKGLEQERKLFPQDCFPDWTSVLEHWRTSIRAVAREIRDGEAAVRFADENDLAYCEVKPLLRLPERKLQLEHRDGCDD